ncbi:MAG: hypothetical protein NTU74_02610, partial [Deltaproteobacteria bacterium]|nr:hypothetical protein [Deltaproteobacteria bacterium]
PVTGPIQNVQKLRDGAAILCFFRIHPGRLFVVVWNHFFRAPIPHFPTNGNIIDMQVFIM